MASAPTYSGELSIAGEPVACDLTLPVTLLCPSEGPASRVDEPVRLGVPFARGVCRDASHVGVRGSDGRLPAQVRALERWPDGSLRWAQVDFRATMQPGLAARYHVIVGPDVPQQAPTMTHQDADGVVIDTGAARFVIRRGGAFPFDAVLVDGRPVIDPACSALSVQLADGRDLRTRIRNVHVEEDGPLRSIVRIEGTADRMWRRILQFELRVHCYAGSATVRLELTLRNPRRAHHRGGIWTLADAGSVFIKDATVLLATPATDAPLRLRCSLDERAAMGPHDVPFGLYQESSGGTNWMSAVHRNRDGVVPHKRRGYRLRAGALETSGLRATPIVALTGPGTSLAMAVPAFWQNFPQAIESDGRAIALRLFPCSYPAAHELQGGEQKTHEWYVAFARDAVTSEELAWCRAPLVPRLDPEAYAAAKAVPYLLPAAKDSQPAYQALVACGLEGANSFVRKREAIDEYGWRHFGEVYADHENALRTSDDPRLVSHYNNQYDLIFGFGCQFLRTGDGRWWELMRDLASHVCDIDIYHTDEDKAAYNHGLFWHTAHYVDAGTSSHRSYPRDPRVGGGGPSAEHNYTAGFVLRYYLTGDPRFRDAALELADWVVAMDDGARSRFRWLARGATGLASATGSLLYHGPGRGAGHSILALLDGFRLSGRREYLHKAEELIRRCIRPDDNIAAHRLDDIENRWSYTAFLQALGRYLDDKAERDEIDEPYTYARAALLHYARWMVEHEYVYLERPERLEYPTETWAAQELRKASVFRYAMMHASDAERAAFAERATFFHRAALEQLERRPTRSCARPLALLMAHGYQEAFFRLHPEHRAPRLTLSGIEGPPCDASVSMPTVFVPQKIRAIRRAAVIAALTAAAILAAGLAALQ